MAKFKNLTPYFHFSWTIKRNKKKGTKPLSPKVNKSIKKLKTMRPPRSLKKSEKKK